MKNIVVIEDEKQLLNVYTSMLTSSDIAVHTAIEGQEGLDIIRKVHPDVILLDIMLPGGMNGFDVLEELKRDDSLKDIPVLVTTNLSSEDKVAKEIGAADYIIKANTSIEDVVAKTKEYLEKK